MIRYESRHVDGIPSLGRHVRNPSTPTAGACSRGRGTLHCPPAIFEVAKPGLPAGPRVIVQSAPGPLPTSRGLVNPRTIQERAQAR
jgi:hypothetical protein